jgi:hypothetical protein
MANMLTGGRRKSLVRYSVEVNGVGRKLQKPGQNDHEEEAIIGPKGIKEHPVKMTANRR